MKSKAQTRIKRFELRLTESEFNAIKKNAASTDKTIANFIREATIQDAVVVQRVEVKNSNNEIVFELRKIGAMMRGFYPKNDATWTNEDKRRYWEAMETLLQKAYAIEKSKR